MQVRNSVGREIGVEGLQCCSVSVSTRFVTIMDEVSRQLN